jgi:hypothetical protein
VEKQAMENSQDQAASLVAQSREAAHSQPKASVPHRDHGQEGLVERSRAVGQAMQRDNAAHEESLFAQKLPNETWQEFVVRIRQPGGNEGNGGGAGQDSNEKARGRSLPDEEKERSRD